MGRHKCVRCLMHLVEGVIGIEGEKIPKTENHPK